MEIKHRFQSSDCVFFELDLLNPLTVTSLNRCQFLPDNGHLTQLLPPSLYHRLRRHLHYVRYMLPRWMSDEQRALGLHDELLYRLLTVHWQRKRPIWIVFMLNSLNEADIRTRGVPVLDVFLAQQARLSGKTIGAVERVDEQCKPLNALNQTQVLHALEVTLSRHEQLREMKGGEQQTTTSISLAQDVRTKFKDESMPTTPQSNDQQSTEALIQQYNCGDLGQTMFGPDSVSVGQLLSSSILSEPERQKEKTDQESSDFAALDDYFKSELVEKRNQRMSDRVMQLLQLNPNHSFFFAFGAGHFLGNGSIVSFLQQAGYEMERLVMKGNGNQFQYIVEQTISIPNGTKKQSLSEWDESWMKLENKPKMNVEKRTNPSPKQKRRRKRKKSRKSAKIQNKDANKPEGHQ